MHRQLLEVLETLRADLLDGCVFNEQQVREHRLPPLFRALGYNPENPAEVDVEYAVQAGSIDGLTDYLVRGGAGGEAFIVETKASNKGLGKRDFRWQAIEFAWASGCGVTVQTNLRRWCVYTAFQDETRALLDWRTPRYDAALVDHGRERRGSVEAVAGLLERFRAGSFDPAAFQCLPPAAPGPPPPPTPHAREGCPPPPRRGPPFKKNEEPEMPAG